MTDNTDEEHFDSPTNTQSENPLDKIIPTKDTETINANKEPENMEVHHHPDLHHRRKHFKEYFLEFLMIFLAVTLGFFAENLREHFTDRAKEKEYMQGMVNDLKADTAFLNLIIFFNDTQRKGCDTLIDILAGNSDNNKTAAYAYALYLKYAWDYYNVAFHIGTYSQLINNKYLRIISNHEVIKAIMDYGIWMSLMNSTEEDFRHLHTSIIDNGGKNVFSNRYLKNFEDSVYSITPDSSNLDFLFYPTEKIISSITNKATVKFMTNDAISLANFQNDLGNYRSYLIYYNSPFESNKTIRSKSNSSYTITIYS